MKNLIAFLLVFCMVLSLAACGAAKDGEKQEGVPGNSTGGGTESENPENGTEGEDPENGTGGSAESENPVNGTSSANSWKKADDTEPRKPASYKCALATPVYPAAVKYPSELDFLGENGETDWDKYSAANEEWFRSKDAARAYLGTYEAQMRSYIEKAMDGFLSDSADQNVICSPINIYMALSMLAECTDGNSRAQILDLLGAKDLEELRAITKGLWNANYSDDGLFTEILGSSLWLNEEFSFNKETVASLAAYYYASVFSGKMDGGDFFEDFKTWLDDQTGGLLKDKIDKLEAFEADDILVIASTIYFKGSWCDEFPKELTKKEVFHQKDKDAEVDFLHRTARGTVYTGDGFTATSMPFEGDAQMWILLPDEGASAEDLIRDGKACSFILTDDKEGKVGDVELALPKFDVSSSMELTGKLQELGVTDVFSYSEADFSPLTEQTGLYVSKVQHDARVKIDEEGCEAAAYTVIMVETAAFFENEKMEFVADRPFIFVITGADGLPMFSGIVNQPAE